MDLRPLSRRFFARDADVVARDLVGASIVHAERVGRIVETEAYFGPPGANPTLVRREDLPPRLKTRLLARGDAASHSYAGVTPRNRVMWGEAGHAYVYLIYGFHECLNATTGRDGEPGGVLLRAAEFGEDPATARGPGKLTRALGVTRAHYGHDLTTAPLYIAKGSKPDRVAVSHRVNVTGARDYPFRFYDPQSLAVTRFARAPLNRRKALLMKRRPEP